MTSERKQRMEEVLSRRQTNLTVLLENVFDPHNVSAIMRSCDAVGVQEIYVLNTRIPPHKKWGWKSSSSAAKWLTVHQFTNFKQCLSELKSRYSTILTTAFSPDAVSLYEADLTGSLVLAFGNEQIGISEELKLESDGHLVIPQVGMIRSLNVSVACAVTLYEAFRQKNVAGHYNGKSLNAETYQLISNKWGLSNEKGI